MGVDSVTEITEITVTPDGPAPGTLLLGKYRIQSVLGVGGYGRVLQAHHLVLDESVAIKILRDDLKLDDNDVNRFIREAQSASRLKSEHVAEIRDVGSLGGGKPYIVMELLEGTDLAHVLTKEGPIHVPFLAELLLHACHALAEAHSHGIVHRDIKPSNLFLATRPDGSRIVKVLDFGIAKAPTSDGTAMTSTQSVLGTPIYMSPEQMRSSRDVDARSDIWSLGTVLYELAEGTPPFKADSFAELCVLVATESPPPMTRAPQLAHIVNRCLQKTTSDRYPSIAELAADLAAFAPASIGANYLARICRVLGRAESLEISAGAAYAAPSQMQTAVRPSRRRRRIVAGVVACAIGVAAAFAIVTMTSSDTPKPAAVAPSSAHTVPTVTAPAARALGSGSEPRKDEAAAAGSDVARPAAGSATTVERISPHPVTAPPRRPAPKQPPVDKGTGSAESQIPKQKPCDPYKVTGGC